MPVVRNWCVLWAFFALHVVLLSLEWTTFLCGIFAISDEIDVCEASRCIVGCGLFFPMEGFSREKCWLMLIIIPWWTSACCERSLFWCLWMITEWQLVCSQSWSCLSLLVADWSWFQHEFCEKKTRKVLLIQRSIPVVQSCQFVKLG